MILCSDTETGCLHYLHIIYTHTIRQDNKREIRIPH